MSNDRPMLRYHGGKWMLAPWIISHFQEHRVYCEPYGGGGSVLLRKERSYSECYNDLCGDVVNLFRVVRDNGAALKEKLRLTPFSRVDYEMARQVVELNDVELARQMVVRSFMGFGSASSGRHYNTGFRSNSNRSGTTPAHDWANYPDCLDGMIERLRGVVIENKCALELMPQHDSDQTLFYVDPPYVHSTRCTRKAYGFEMDDDDHRDMAEVLRALRGKVVLSGYACPLYSELFGDWHCEQKAALGDGACERTEILWMNFNPTKHRPQMEML